MDPALLQNYPFEDYVKPPSIPVWQARPLHYPPTCRQDKIFLSLIEERKLSSQTGGHDSELAELSDAKFPAVAPLLNPQNHASSHPLTASIVSVSHCSPLRSLVLTLKQNIIYCYSLDNFPQQVSLVPGNAPDSRAYGSRLVCCSTSIFSFPAHSKRFLAAAVRGF